MSGHLAQVLSAEQALFFIDRPLAPCPGRTKQETPHAASRAGFLVFSTVDRPILP
jgi:hypothetical protein